MLSHLRARAGFTLVESMVAMTLLLIGLLGTVKLIDAASSSQGSAKAREAATNLARELLEDAHDTSYSTIGSAGWLTPAMQGLNGGSGLGPAPHAPGPPTPRPRPPAAHPAPASPGPGGD